MSAEFKWAMAAGAVSALVLAALLAFIDAVGQKWSNRLDYCKAKYDSPLDIKLCTEGYGK